MSFWSDISRFAGNLTGGFIGESDAEKKKKKQQQFQAQNPYIAKPANSPAPRQSASQTPTQQRARQVFSGINAQGNMSMGQRQAQTVAQNKVKRGLRVEADPIDQEIDDDRKEIVERSFNEGRSFEEISDRTGLGVEEVRRYADKKRPDYGKKPMNLTNLLDATGQMGKELVGDVGTAVTKMTGLTSLPTKDRENAYQAARGAFDRGEITNQKFFELTGELGKDIIGKKVDRDAKGNVIIRDQTPLEFGQDFVNTGYNAASGLPIVGGAKLAGLPAKQILKEIVKEGAAWGTVDTANDAVQGRLSPEQIAANYALNIGMTGGGAVGGKLAKGAVDPRANQFVKDNLIPGGILGGPLGKGFQEADANGRVFEGAEGKPRYEIDDSGSKLKTPRGIPFLSSKEYREASKNSQMALSKYKSTGDAADLDEYTGAYRKLLKTPKEGSHLLGSIFKHEDLYANYPELADIKVIFKKLDKDEGGAAHAHDGIIEINSHSPKAKQRETLLHEIQHIIQRKEGFAGGGNPDALKGKEVFTEAELDEWAKLTTTKDFGRPLTPAQEKRLTELSKKKSPYNAYRHLAGEAESRAVGARKDMTPEERQATPFYDSLDVSKDELIFRGADGPASSLDAPLKDTDARARFGKPKDLGDKDVPQIDTSPETLMARAVEAGMTPQGAAGLMNKIGRNKFRVMLDESGNLNGAQNPEVLATYVANNIPDGSKQIGGVATKNDAMPNETTLNPALEGLRNAEKNPTESMKADRLEVAFNEVERVVDDAGWERDAKFIRMGTDNDASRLAQVVDKRFKILTKSSEDKVVSMKDENDVVHFADPQTGEEIATFHYDDLAAKAEAFVAVKKYVDTKTPETTAPTASPKPAPAPKAIEPRPVPKSIKDITKKAPKRGDLEGHKARVEDAEMFAMKLSDDATAELKKHGYTFEDMVTQIDDGYRALRDGAESVDIDTPVLNVYRKLRKEMDKAYGYRQKLEIDGRKTEDFGNINDLYWPRYGEADIRNTSLLDRIEDASVLSRSSGSGMSADSIDKSPRALSKYMVEMLGAGDNKRILDAIDTAAKEGRTITPNQAMKQIDLENAFLKNVEETAKNGKIRNQDHAQSLVEIGRAKGKEIHTVTEGVARGAYLEAFRQFKSLKIDETQTLDDLMSKPYRAHNYADDLVRSGGDIAEDMRTTFKDLDPQHLSGLLNRYQKSMDHFTDEKGDITEYKIALTESIYHRAAVQDIVDYLETHQFTDDYTNNLINYQLGPLLVKGKIDQNLGQKLSRMYTTMTDRALRGWNLKSFSVELTEMQKLPTMFGIPEFTQASTEMLDPRNIMDILERKGKAQSLGTTREFFEANPTALEKIGKIMDSNNATKLIKLFADPHTGLRAVEIYRSAVSLRTIELHHQHKGLTGRELTDQVWDDFRRAALPSDQETHISIQRNAASRAIFQYWQWNVRNTALDGRMAIGTEDIGHIKKGAGSRGRYITMSLANKTAIWMAYAGTGTTAAYAFNLFDPFGILEEEYTGVAADEMELKDYAMQAASFSPLTSLVGAAYFAHRQEEERLEDLREKGEEWKAKDKDPQYKQDNVINSAQRSAPYGNLIPGTGQFKKSKGMDDMQKKGFYEGTDGRVRYQAATGNLDIALGYIFGRNATDAAKEYNDAPNPLFEGFAKNGVEGFLHEARKDPLIGAAFGSTKERQRPLSTSSFDKGYNEQAKEAYKAASEKHGQNSDEARKVMRDWIDLGRKYNKVMDDFRTKNPAGYNKWQGTFDDNHVSPEKWQIYRGNPEVFEFAKARKLLEAKDLGRTVDPIYHLPTERAKDILQYRSMATGDDMRQATMLYKTDWYEKFTQDMDAYGKTFEGKGDMQRTDRAKEWYTLSDTLRKTIEAPEFNLVKQLQDMEFGSQAGKDFLRANYDAWKAQKDAYDRTRFDTVNRMRQIEGHSALTWDQFTAKIEFESDSATGASTGDGSGSGWKNYAKGSRAGSGGGGGGDTPAPTKTGVDDTITNFGNSAKGIADPKIAKGKLVDSRKVVKKMKRASGMSRIRIKI